MRAIWVKVQTMIFQTPNAADCSRRTSPRNRRKIHMNTTIGAFPSSGGEPSVTGSGGALIHKSGKMVPLRHEFTGVRAALWWATLWAYVVRGQPA